MDITTYALSKKIAAHAVSGVQSMSVSGQTLTINTKDSGVLTMTFPTPKDGVSVTDIDVNANNQIVFTMSDGSEIISGKIPTVKGDKGDAGFSPIITENADNTDKIYKLDITTADSTFTTPNLKGADGQGGTGGGEENIIDSISVNGVNVTPDENKNVDITVPSIEGLTKDEDLATVAKSGDYEDLINKPTIPDITGLATETYVDNKVADYTKTVDLADVATSGSYNDLTDKPTIPSLDGYAKTSEIPSKVSELENDSNYLSSIPEEYITDTELESKGYLTEHQDISGKVDKVEGKSLISDAEIARLATVDNYDDTNIKAEIAKKADTTAIPSKVSELTNDSNYQTAEQVNNTVTTEIAKIVADAPESLNTLKEMSDWIAGHEDDASAMNSAISDNKTAITALQTGKADKSEIPTTVAELTDSANYAKTTDVNDSISALQTDKADASDLTTHTGDSVIHVTAENKTLWNTVSNKVNKEDGKALLADTDKTNYDDAVTKAHTHENKEVLDGITSDKVTYWDNKSDFSGSYNDLNDKPTIDAELSNTSENAIQNKVVTEEINKLYSDISFNDHDTATSGTSFTDAEDGNMLVTDWTKNLLNPTLETTTINGVTCTNNGDGTYTLNGTATDIAIFAVTVGAEITEKHLHEHLWMTGCPETGSMGTYRLKFWSNVQEPVYDFGGGSKVYIEKTASDGGIEIIIDTGFKANNLVFKPMLTTDLSATYDNFVPYSGYDIKTCGKNLIDFLKIPFTCNTLATYTINNGILDISCNELDNSGLFFIIHKCYNALMRRKFKISFDVKASVGGKFNIGVEGTKMLLFDVGTEYERKVLEFEAVLKGPFDIYNMSGVSQHLYIKDFIIDIVDELDGIPTAYEPYTGETITVTNETESPAFGLKSHKGITNIISPGNVKCVYPTNESGKGVLDSLYNKDKMLTEQNNSLEVLGKCKNLLNPTLQTTTQNGVTCTNNGDGTYTLNGRCNLESGRIAFCLLTDIRNTKYIKDIKYVGNTKDSYEERTAYLTVDIWKDNTWVTGSDVADEHGFLVNDIIENAEFDLIEYTIHVDAGKTCNNVVIKPMLTTNLNATYDDFVPYTGDGETLTHDVAEMKNDLDKIKPSVIGDDWGKSWTYKVSSTTPKMFALHWSNSTVIFCVFYGKVIPFNQPFAEETYTANVDGNTLTVTTSETGILRTI